MEVVAGIIEHNGKFLCMQRKEGKYAYTSFKWEFPGGKIERNESEKQALKRELFEEMEMDVDISDKKIDVFYKYPDFEISLHCYFCTAKDAKFVMNAHKSFKWLPPESLFDLDWAAADAIVVEKILEEK